jgi:hypothetical protein
MKLSVETGVAAAITASFVALTLGAMTRENSGTKCAAVLKIIRDVDELIKDGSLTNLADAEKQSRGSRQQNDA